MLELIHICLGKSSNGNKIRLLQSHLLACIKSKEKHDFGRMN